MLQDRPGLQVPMLAWAAPGGGACCAVAVLVDVSVLFRSECLGDCAMMRFEIKVRSANT